MVQQPHEPSKSLEGYVQPMLNQAARRLILQRDDLIKKMRRATSPQTLADLQAKLREMNRSLGLDALEGVST